mmetsp:Transcript_17035/g.34920  ORF Transcript_17035/g.34920 Transcript_17035/m.34920 type:complete len:154 (+) Transcript_17035:996-1457(+)
MDVDTPIVVRRGGLHFRDLGYFPLRIGAVGGSFANDFVGGWPDSTDRTGEGTNERVQTNPCSAQIELAEGGSSDPSIVAASVLSLFDSRRDHVLRNTSVLDSPEIDDLHNKLRHMMVPDLHEIPVPSCEFPTRMEMRLPCESQRVRRSVVSPL